MKLFRRIAGALLLVLVATLLIVTIRNSAGLDHVVVTFIGPGAERADASFAGIGKDDALPDYRLEVVHSSGIFRCGTELNRSAASGIEFFVRDDVPIRQVREVILVDDDRLGDDVLVRTQLTAPVITSGGYEFRCVTQRSFMVGLTWFFSTIVGKAIITGITIAVVAMILAAVGISF